MKIQQIAALNPGSPYHDTVLAEHVRVDSSWREIEIGSVAQIERDVQMVGLRLAGSTWLDFEAGEIKSEKGEGLQIEIQLVTDNDDGTGHRFYFASARGESLVSFRSETPLPEHVRLRTLKIRSEIPFDVESIIWTTYDTSDRK